VIAKTYRSKSGVNAHERSHTEAFFRKVKFWDGVAPGTPGMDTTLGLSSGGSKLSIPGEPEGGGGGGEGESSSKESNSKRFGDAPPVFVMPDGYSYMHVKRNGLIFGCATEKNISPVVVIEVSILLLLLHVLVIRIIFAILLFYDIRCAPLIINTMNAYPTNQQCYSYFQRLQRYLKIIVALYRKNQLGRILSFYMNY